MKLQELLSSVGDTMTVRRVFAEPYEKDGITVIPGAAVAGGGGGGSGHDERGQQGDGGGFGMNARPAGAFVIKSGEVSWRPALDLNRLLMIIGGVTAIAILTRRRRHRHGLRGRFGSRRSTEHGHRHGGGGRSHGGRSGRTAARGGKSGRGMLGGGMVRGEVSGRGISGRGMARGGKSGRKVSRGGVLQAIGRGGGMPGRRMPGRGMSGRGMLGRRFGPRRRG